MFNTRFLPLIALGILAGCAAQPAKNQTVDKANTATTAVQCHAEQDTGSLIPHTVCTTKAQRDAQQVDVDDIKNVAEKPAAACIPGRCSQSP